MACRGGVLEAVRLPSLLPLLALFSGEEARVATARIVLEQLSHVSQVVEDRVTIGQLEEWGTGGRKV